MKEIAQLEPLPKMLTLKEASEITPFSYYALRKLCLESKIAHIRNGNKIFINYNSLSNYMNGGDLCKKL